MILHFSFFTFVFKITILIPSPPRSYRHLAGIMYHSRAHAYSLLFSISGCWTGAELEQNDVFKLFALGA